MIIDITINAAVHVLKQPLTFSFIQQIVKSHVITQISDYRDYHGKRTEAFFQI